MQETIIKVENQIFTQSEISVWDECSYKWYLRYQKRLDLVGVIHWPLVVGTVWHQLMEALYRAKGKNADKLSCNVANYFEKDVVMTTEIQKECEYWNAVLEAMIQAYARFYADDFKVFKPDDYEKTLEVEVEVDGVKFSIAGKRDMKGFLGLKGKSQMDHKTTGQISKSITEGWEFKFQFMLYLWLDWECGAEPAQHFIVNATKKPLLRRKDGEHIVTFASRVKQDMVTQPEKYFYRQALDLTIEGIKNFKEKILLPKLRRIATLQNHPELIDVLALNKNTDACNHYGGQCDYFAMCYFGEKKQYKQREIKHRELEMAS